MSTEELDLADIDEGQLRPADDEALATLLDHEATAATDYRGYTDAQQADGLGYYLADPNYLKYTRVSDEGTTSQMVSKDVAENIDDLMPDLLRMCRASDYMIEFEAGAPGDTQHLKHATRTVNALLRMQEDFPLQLHDFIKDGLLQKLGLFEIVVLEGREIPEVISNVSRMTVSEYSIRSDVVDVDVEEINDPENPDMVNLRIRRRTPRTFRANAVAPEELLVCADADSLDQRTPEGPRYVSIRKRMSVASAIQQWPEKRDLWVKAAASGQANTIAETTERESALLRQQREWRGENMDAELRTDNLLASSMDVMREYYRVDLDGDGFPELNMIVRVGRMIIHQEPVEDNPFAYWCPYRIPHCFIGESQADKIMNIQDLNTSFWRVANDAAAFAARPRVAYDHPAAIARETPTMADIIRAEPGAAIRTPGDPNRTLMPVKFSDVTAPALKALEFADTKKEGWSGQSRRSRGLSPDLPANESGQRFEAELSAGSGRKEFLATNLAFGLEMLGGKYLRSVTRYGEEIPVNMGKDEWVKVDPSSWSHTLRPIVHVSGAVGSREIESRNLMVLGGELRAFVDAAGFENPWIGYPEIAAVIRALVHTYGFRDDTRFIKDPDPEMQGKFIENRRAAVREDPKVTAQKIAAKSKEAEIQGSAQLDKYRLDQVASTARLKVLTDAKLRAKQMKLKKEIDDKQMELKAREVEIKEKELSLERARLEVERRAASAEKKEESDE